MVRSAWRGDEDVRPMRADIRQAAQCLLGIAREQQRLVEKPRQQVAGCE
jgi:hypothetical protein